MGREGGRQVNRGGKEGKDEENKKKNKKKKKKNLRGTEALGSRAFKFSSSSEKGGGGVNY